jgi:hypothetical protein
MSTVAVDSLSRHGLPVERVEVRETPPRPSRAPTERITAILQES